MAKVSRWVIAAAGAALAVRVARSRHRRFLHPDGRSFAGGLELFDSGDRHDATVRISKGAGTAGGRADIRGVAIRVHLPGRDLDVLLSTAGKGRLTRYLPVLRRSFDTVYSTITAYRMMPGRKVYLTARPDPDGPALGRELTQVGEGDRLLLQIRETDGFERSVARLRLGRPLPPETDGALAFDPVRNSLPELHPTGLVHGLRAFAYRTGQHWRGVTPARPDPAAVARTAAHR
jgi:hypothetical protein